tara:strand:+ start:264 stop:548 length:285 start_codon:yes stop_codon:yes gene_type:complete
MTDNTDTTDLVQDTTPTEPQILGHEFSGDTCKVRVQAVSSAQLTAPAMKKAVYEYRHTIGASHMGLNKFEFAGSKQASDGTPVAEGYWYLLAGF